MSDPLETSEALHEAGKNIAFEALDEYCNCVPTTLTVLTIAVEIAAAIMFKAVEALNPNEDLDKLKRELLEDISDGIDEEMKNVSAVDASRLQ